MRRHLGQSLFGFGLAALAVHFLGAVLFAVDTMADWTGANTTTGANNYSVITDTSAGGQFQGKVNFANDATQSHKYYLSDPTLSAPANFNAELHMTGTVTFSAPTAIDPNWFFGWYRSGDTRHRIGLGVSLPDPFEGGYMKFDFGFAFTPGPNLFRSVTADGTDIYTNHNGDLTSGTYPFSFDYVPGPSGVMKATVGPYFRDLGPVPQATADASIFDRFGFVQRTTTANPIPFNLVISDLTYTGGTSAIEPAEFQWAVNASGLWSVGTNWATGVEPNGAGKAVRFGAVIDAPQLVIVDGPRTVGAIAFDNANAYHLAGPGMLTIDGPAPTIDLVQGSHSITGPLAIAAGQTLVVQGPGTLTLSGAQSHGAGAALSIVSGTINLNADGGTNLAIANAATLNLGATQHLASLNVGSTGTTTLVAGGSKVLVAGGLAIDAGGKLDVTNNDTIVQATAGTKAAVLASVTGFLTTGSSGLAWTGNGINSSTAAADASFLTAVGVMLNDDGFGGAFHASFSGQPADANSILVKYTYYGDADLSGAVDGTDYALIDNGFNSGSSGWFNGDFNYSGTIDGTDYALIDNAFNSQSGPLGPGPMAPAVPEPGTLALAALGLVGVVIVRRQWLPGR